MNKWYAQQLPMQGDPSTMLRQLLESVAPLSSTSIRSIREVARIRSMEKDALLCEEGKKDANEYFLLEGLAYRFNRSEDGKPITTGFWRAPEVMIPHFARTQKGLSIFSVQMLTDVSVAVVSVRDFDRLRAEHPDIGRWGNRVVERQLLQSLQEETVFRAHDAKRRLTLLRKQFPGLENNVPHHLIASYLGITPVSFSRLRKQMARQ